MNKNWILFFEIVALSALFLAPLSLISVDGSLLFPYVTSKAFAWRLAIAFGFAAWVSLAVFDARYRFSWKNPIFLSFTTFMVIMFTANMLGYDPYRSFWSNAERMDGYIGLLHMYAFFIMLLGLGQKKTIWKSFLYVMIGLGVLLGIVALGQDKIRADAWLGNPIYLASFSSFALFACGYLMMAKEKLFNNVWLKELVFGLLALFFVAVIFKTGTRGAVLGLVFGGFAGAVSLALSVKEQEYIWWRRIGMGTTILVMLVVAGFFGGKSYLKDADWVQNNTLLKRSVDFSLQDTTTIHRLANWGQAIDGFKERPLLGWGQENYIHVFSKYYRANVLHNAEQWFDRTHNMFLDWLVFGGILGFGSFLSILGLSFWTLWRKTGDYFSSLEKSVLTAALVGYMAQNFVAFDALATGMWFILFIAIIAIGYQNTRPTKSTPIDIARYKYLLPVMWIFMIIGIYQTLVVPRSAMIDFMAIYKPLPSQQEGVPSYEERYERIERALQQNTFFNQEFTEQLLSQHARYINTGASEEIRIKFIRLVMAESDYILEKQPYLTRLRLLYALYYKNGQDYDGAYKHLKIALETSPHKLSILWYLAQVEALRGNDKESLAYYQEAFDLAPNSDQARKFLSQAISTSQSTDQ